MTQLQRPMIKVVLKVGAEAKERGKKFSLRSASKQRKQQGDRALQEPILDGT